MDINNELNQIIRRYSLDSYYPEYSKQIKAGVKGKDMRFYPEHKLGEYKLDAHILKSDIMLEYIACCTDIANCKDVAELKRQHKRMFFLTIYMRDFLMAEELINEWEDLKSQERISSAWKEIQNLLAQIKKAMEETQEDSIIWYWIDSLPEEEAKEMPYLQERAKHSVYFENAYTCTPFTTPTLESTLYGFRRVDDFYNRENLPFNVPKILEEHGYDFNIISRAFPTVKESIVTENIDNGMPCSMVFWDMLNEILLSKKKGLFLAHALVELHSPCFYLGMNNPEKNASTIRHTEARKIVERQLKFYDDLLKKDLVRIYMSDHGFQAMPLSRVHVHFQVYQSDWSPEHVKGMYSHLDFSKILNFLIRKEKIQADEVTRTFAPFQDVDFYNKNLIQEAIEKQYAEWFLVISYKGIVTNNYSYVRYKTGQEYFLRKKGVKNIYHDTPMLESNTVEASDEELREARKLTGDFPAKIDNDEKFKYSKYLYKVYDNIVKTSRAAQKILNEYIASYPDKSLAIRSGGNHTLNLLLFLNGENKDKFSCIIDNNPKCFCKDFGIDIIDTEKPLPEGTKYILLSSKIYLDNLKKEANKLYPQYETIDIYDMLKQKGYDFHLDFFHGLKSDYDVDFPFDE